MPVFLLFLGNGVDKIRGIGISRERLIIHVSAISLFLRGAIPCLPIY